MRNNMILKIILILIISCTTITTTIYATDYNPKDLVKDESYNPNKGDIPSEFATFAKKALGAISIIGTILTVIIIAVIGFEYITGSSQDIAEIKTKFGRNTNRYCYDDRNQFYSKINNECYVKEVII